MGQSSTLECKTLNRIPQSCGCREPPEGKYEAFFPSGEPDGAADDVLLETPRATAGLSNGSTKHNGESKHDSASSACTRRAQTRKNTQKEHRPASLEVPGLRHLVLNVDINRTIIMTDSTGGKTMEMIVNETLAHAAWGEDSADGTSWVLRSPEPSVLRPTPDTTEIRHHPSLESRRTCDTYLLSYSEWLEKQMPGSENRKNRQKLMMRFTEEGQPGESLASYRIRALEMLRNADGSDVRIIPAFFELLLWLKREKRSFCICFRTFGEDLSDVAEELTSFCEGRHPLFPNARMDGSDGEPDYRFSVQDIGSCGTFHRDQECLSLIMGTTEQSGEGKYRDEKDRSLEFYKIFQGVQIIKGWSEVQEFVLENTSQCKTLGFRDYFQYWKKIGMKSDGGKLFFYKPSRFTQHHELFFDDNIHYNDFFIVQPINLTDARRSFPSQLLNTHVCRAEPLESIFDKHYFIRHVVRLENCYEKKLITKEKLRNIILKIAKKVVRERMRIRGASKLRTSEYDPWANYRVNDEDLALDDDYDLEAARAW